MCSQMNELASMGHHCKHTKNGLCKCKCNVLFKGTYNPRYSHCSIRVRLLVFAIVILVFDWQDAGSVRPLDRSAAAVDAATSPPTSFPTAFMTPFPTTPPQPTGATYGARCVGRDEDGNALSEKIPFAEMGGHGENGTPNNGGVSCWSTPLGRNFRGCGAGSSRYMWADNYHSGLRCA